MNRLFNVGPQAAPHPARLRRVFAATAAIVVMAAALPASAGTREGSFPMKAEAFQQKIDARIARARSHLEERLQKSQASDADAKQARAQLDATVAKIQAAAKKATADGTVTADEAKTVREASRELRAHKKKGKHKAKA